MDVEFQILKHLARDAHPTVAIAHGLEEVYQPANPENSQPKTTKGKSRKKTTQEPV
ncbi:hypothetical protein [Nostoc sp.]|uniref:hypothetical protein n=1 Tax=Nostoc sp. TaxID=1180 RepID=UPI002FFB2106